MMASLPTLAVIALSLAPVDISGISIRCAAAIEQAQQDFEARRGELGLIGSAPMVGLERIASLEQAELDARRAELGMIGSAPMVGLERVSHGASLEHGARSAAEEDVVSVSSARHRGR